MCWSTFYYNSSSSSIEVAAAGKFSFTDGCTSVKPRTWFCWKKVRLFSCSSSCLKTNRLLAVVHTPRFCSVPPTTNARNAATTAHLYKQLPTCLPSSIASNTGKVTRGECYSHCCRNAAHLCYSSTVSSSFFLVFCFSTQSFNHKFSFSIAYPCHHFSRNHYYRQLCDGNCEKLRQTEECVCTLASWAKGQTKSRSGNSFHFFSILACFFGTRRSI